MNGPLAMIGVLCCFALLQLNATDNSVEPEHQIVEKRSKSDSKIKLRDFTTGGSIGATGDKGPTGPAGEGFSEAYISAFQLEDVNLGVLETGDIVHVPLSNVDYAKNISLDTNTSTFTLPKGIYLFDFQFLIAEINYTFKRMFLTLGASEHLTAWSQGTIISAPSESLSSFFGSTIFEITEDNTQVQFLLEILNPTGQPFVFTNLGMDDNYPTRLVVRKIANLS